MPKPKKELTHIMPKWKTDKDGNWTKVDKKSQMVEVGVCQACHYIACKCGAPTLYREEYCKAVINYSERPDTKSMTGFAAALRVSEPTVKNWTEKFPAFKNCYEVAKTILKAKMIDGIGHDLMTGELKGSAGVFSMAMKNQHGWADKQDINQNLSGKMGLVAVNTGIDRSPDPEDDLALGHESDDGITSDTTEPEYTDPPSLDMFEPTVEPGPDWDEDSEGDEDITVIDPQG